MIADDYVDGKSIDELSTIHGLGQRMIHNILRGKGLNASDRKVVFDEPGDPRPRSQLHLKIGRQLHDHYYVKKGLNRPDAAEALGVSSKALRGIEMGINPLCLTDLQNIALYMDTNVGELVDGS